MANYSHKHQNKDVYYCDFIRIIFLLDTSINFEHALRLLT